MTGILRIFVCQDDPISLKNVYPFLKFQLQSPWYWCAFSPLQLPMDRLQKQLEQVKKPAFCITVNRDRTWELLAYTPEQAHYVIGFPPKAIDKALCGQVLNTLTALGLSEGHPIIAADHITEKETQSAAGYLPRFLAQNGLGQIFSSWQEQPQDGKALWQDNRVPKDLNLAVDYWTQTVEPRPLKGKPLAMPVESLHQLFRLPWFCDGRLSAIIDITDIGNAPEPEWSREETASHLVSIPDGYRIQFDPYGNLFALFGRMQDALYLLKDWFKAGMSITLKTAVVEPDPSETDDDIHPDPQVYKGTLAKRQFQLTETYPALSDEAIGKALIISRWVDDNDALDVSQMTAIQSIIDQAVKSWDVEKKHVKLRENKLEVTEDTERGLLAGRIFRRYCSQYWPIHKGSLFDDDDKDFDAFTLELTKPFQKPNSGTVLLDGKSGRFIESSLALDKDPSVQILKKEMEETGFGYLQSFIWEPGSDVLVHAFAKTDSQAYGVVMNSLSGAYYEFYTEFEDQSSITTSSNTFTEDQTKGKMRKYGYTGLSTSELYEQHLKNIEKYYQQKTALDAPVDFQVFLERLDGFMVRFLKIPF